MAYAVEADALIGPACAARPEVKRPRVLAVIPAAEGASMIFARRQVADLREAGIEVETFYLTSRTSPLVLFPEWRRLRRVLRVFRPDVVHAHFGTVTALFCAVSTMLPLVITYRGSDLNPSPSVSPLRSLVGRLFSQLAALRARRIICVSGQLRDRLLWGRRRAMVIPSAVDTRIFHPLDRTGARSELGWSPSERVVLFNAGRFPRVKRLDLAQAAVEFARTCCGPIRLMILNGYTEPATVPILLNAADCLLVTSDWEGSPNIVKEALACNLPVVSVDVGDVCERLAGVEPSRIVGRQPEEIGQAVAELLSSGERSNGFQAIQALSQDKVAQAVYAVYRDAWRG